MEDVVNYLKHIRMLGNIWHIAVIMMKKTHTQLIVPNAK